MVLRIGFEKGSMSESAPFVYDWLSAVRVDFRSCARCACLYVYFIVKGVGGYIDSRMRCDIDLIEDG